MARIEEAVCRRCPLLVKCDPNLGPYKYVNGGLVTCTDQYECPVYTCGDGRVDAQLTMQTEKPQKFKAMINGEVIMILAVVFGKIFAKFKDTTMIASVPEGNIYTLPLGISNLFYQTGQSAFFDK